MDTNTRGQKASSRTVGNPAADGHATTRPSRGGERPQAAIGLAPEAQRSVVRILGELLADQHVLYQKTRMCHWNLVGSRFDPLHRLFEAQYEALAEAMDGTAERIRMLDGVAPAAMAELLRDAQLREVPGRLVGGQEALGLLLADHEAVVRTLRRDIELCDEEHGDAGTTDYLTGLLREHEKTAWMIRSHLEAP